MPPEPAAARITAPGTARRQQLVATAATMFLEQGYSAVSLDDIIRTAGGSKTNLYRFFGGKEGLFAEIVQQTCETFLDELKSLELDNLAPADGLRVLARTLLRRLLEERHVAFQRLVLAESGRFPAMAAIWFESGPQSSRRIIRRFIDAKQRSGEMRPGPSEQTAIFFHDMIVTDPIYRALLGRPPAWPEVLGIIDRAIDTLLEGERGRAA